MCQVNKGISSGTRPITVENSEAYVQKQALEEENKKKKEEERLKRQAKEETAKKKKEKALKATAEEAKRYTIRHSKLLCGQFFYHPPIAFFRKYNVSVS